MKYQEPEKLSDSKLKAYHWWLHSRYSREDVSRKEVARRHTEAVRVMEARGVKHPRQDKLDRATVDDFARRREGGPGKGRRSPVKDEDQNEAEPGRETQDFAQSLEESHSRSKCMRCDEPPVVDVQWADGRGRAWFCLPCFREWIKGEYEGDDREIVRAFHVLDGEVPKKIGDGEQVKKLGDQLKDKEIAERIEKLTGMEEARRLDDTYKPEYFEKWMDWDRHVRAWNAIKPHLRGQSFLDVGCGMGFALSQLRQAGYRVRGTEVSPWAIGFCAALGIRVDRASATKLPYEDGSFDTVFSMFLLDDVPGKAVEESIRVARMRAVHLVPDVEKWAGGELADGFRVLVHDKSAAKSGQEA